MRNPGPVVHGHNYMPPRPAFVPTPMPERPPRRKGNRRLLFGVGILCIAAGVGLIVGPLVGVWTRGSADQAALNAWRDGGSNALLPNTNVAPDPGKLDCGSPSPDDFALVSFNAPAKYHYKGVAGNGNWDTLHDRSMVHYSTTPAPGAQGNVIIAFHREPNYEHIDELNVGDTVDIQDRNCHTWTYKVTQRSTLDPGAVTQLVPTPGHELTLITCTPFWQDSQRIVWRAELVT